MSFRRDPFQRYGTPVLAICGFSGSGKTTLLEAAIPQLVARGLSVAVVKHDAHGVIVDTPGKDSDRLFQAGATVALRGANQQFQRRGLTTSLTLDATLADLARDHDLVLVEGHKDTQLPKFWLEDSVHTAVAENIVNVIATLKRESQRLACFLEYVDAWLPKAWSARPLYRGLLIGGKSSRMGSAKQLLKFGDRQLGEIVAAALGADRCRRDVLTLGAGPVPPSLDDLVGLPDAPGFKGPCAGLLAAHRWAPEAAWVVAACDHPWLRMEDIEWLISLRRPGNWALVPRQEDGHPCPILALYEPQALAALERRVIEQPENARIAALLDHPRTLIIDPPPEHKRACANVNTPEEFRNAELLPKRT
ncbi:MAG TPA: molybdopterin-guanine dinucleotide biosynthesis protein B [Clostridia bacterium]|nr:molybdopterin-guanine dinucleotide biosynthesis protein B [Clostridia bacterium]